VAWWVSGACLLGRGAVVLALGGLALVVRWLPTCRACLALAFVVVVVARGDGSDAAGSHRRLRIAAGEWSFSAALCRCWWATVEIRSDR
jgi:peptidoglycan/LPS O-acetylase OafA/YrhL